MKLGAHGVVVVARHGAQQGAVLPVPYPNRLVVTSADNPGELVVEKDGADIIQMPIQREQTPAGLVRPDLDLVVITTRDEEGLPWCQSNCHPRICLARTPSPVSCENQHRGPGHRVLRIGQSGCPCGNPTVGW